MPFCRFLAKDILELITAIPGKYYDIGYAKRNVLA
jgi:hypothetical protein